MKYTLSFFILLIAACKNPQTEKPTNEGANNFSLYQFAQDQFHSYWGQPLTLIKKVTLNGKVDSSYVSVFNMDWDAVLGVFFNADISDKKYNGKYNLSVLIDNATDSKTYYYEAKEKSLFTRSLQVVTDPMTNRVKSIYLETAKNGKTAKLYYAPVKKIQIQEFESSFMGGKKDLKVEYQFLN